MTKPKNHFLYSYVGNKKDESVDIIEAINFNKIENIIEPFCGSGALSYNIWLKYGNKFKYHLNDYDENLINIYKFLKENDVDYIEDKINKIKEQVQIKDDWIKKVNEYKETKNILLYIFIRKYSSMGRFGFWKLKMSISKFKITDEQKNFIKFIKEPYVEITNNDWMDVFNKFKNDNKSIIIFDPPYMFSENGFYLSKKSVNNVYEYFYKNTLKLKSHIYFILENVWINEAIFKNFKIIKTYKKIYELSKKHTEHIIYYNLL